MDDRDDRDDFDAFEIEENQVILSEEIFQDLTICEGANSNDNTTTGEIRQILLIQFPFNRIYCCSYNSAVDIIFIDTNEGTSRMFQLENEESNDSTETAGKLCNESMF